MMGSVLYYGVIDADNAFTRVTFRSASVVDFFGFDDLTVGSLGTEISEQPEPGTIILFGSGLFGLAVYGWRRKQQTV